MSHPPAHPAERAAATQPTTTSGLAIAALTLGVLGLVVPLLGIAAIVIGVMAIDRIDDPANRRAGRGFAVAGALLGGLGIALMLMLMIVGVVVPALHTPHRHGPTMYSNTQLRGIHQSMIVYAQNNKTGRADGRFPGLDPQGDLVSADVTHRFQIMLEQNMFSPDYIINPHESGMKQVWTGGPVTVDNYSYSMLDIFDAGGRRDEWAETLNSDAIVLSDRNTGRNAHQHVSSVITNTDSGSWRGGVVRNDNRVETVRSHVIPETQYGAGSRNQDDNLFDATHSDEALLMHENP